MSERLYIISYDISDSKRLRKISSIMEGYGYRIQYSVFQCHLSELKLEQLKTKIISAINQKQDQCLIIDLGEENNNSNNITSIGRPFVKIPKLTII